MRMRYITLAVCTVAMLAGSIQGLAQGPQQERQRENPPMVVTTVAGPQTGMTTQVGGDGYVFVASEMSFDRKLVKGAPYSAVAITESVQTLADGNRLVHKSSASIYRDSEGRTRRDQVLAKIGPYASAGDTPQTIFINDPVAQVNYILEPGSRTARKVNLPNVVMRTAPTNTSATPNNTSEDKIRARESQETATFTRADREKVEVIMQAATVSGGVGAGMGAMTVTLNQGGKKWNPVKESLGKQLIEGVEAEGIRTTITIPAGEFGNELPLNIVTETWTSAELQAVVKSRHSDPRSGETVYTLTNINRSEPAHSLFEVPADYTIKEQPGADMKMRIEKQIQQKKDEK